MSAMQLSSLFSSVAVKRLSQVEASRSASNQHEFNGVAALRRLFGERQPQKIPTRFIRVDDENAPLTADDVLTWYDARDAHPTRTEYRLYFRDNAVVRLAGPGDSLLIGLRPDGTALLILAAAGSTAESQLLHLFGLGEPTLGFEERSLSAREGGVDFVRALILENLGIEAAPQVTADHDELVSRFGLKFPTTIEFSAWARETAPKTDPVDDPDGALMTWLEHEEGLFRALERRIVAERLSAGFMQDARADVDGFLQFSLSVQNRRKARAGAALENHLEAVFSAHRLKFDTQARTENGNRPDFVFPGEAAYQDLSFPAERLTVLGAKSTCKDRWRQVLSEAARVEQKYLLTLEPAISENQTSEMQLKKLQLIVPRRLHASYRPGQQSWLFDVAAFITEVAERQAGDRG